MNATIQIAVLLCVVIANGMKKDLTLPNILEYISIQGDNHSRGRRGYDKLSTCDRAILSCCADTKENQRRCFHNFKCSKTYKIGDACSKERIDSVLSTFTTAYSGEDSARLTREKRWHYVYNQSTANYPARGPTTIVTTNTQVQQEYLPRIVTLLEEISTYLRNPQPQHLLHPIYIPYPIPYPYNQPDITTTTETLPNIEVRGLGGGGDDDNNDDDGARPISFVPIKSDRALKRVPPKVEHGSIQSVSQQTKKPSLPASPNITAPITAQTPCFPAILACCADKAAQKNCFSTFGCGGPYYNENTCKPDSIQIALASFSKKNN